MDTKNLKDRELDQVSGGSFAIKAWPETLIPDRNGSKARPKQPVKKFGPGFEEPFAKELDEALTENAEVFTAGSSGVGLI